MPSVFSNLLYIGNFAEMDTVESNDTSENPDIVAGACSNAACPCTHWNFATTIQTQNGDALVAEFTNGAWVEALQRGPMSCRSLDPRSLTEIRALIPGFGQEEAQPLARPCASMLRQKRLIERARRIRVPLFDKASLSGNVLVH